MIWWSTVGFILLPNLIRFFLVLKIFVDEIQLVGFHLILLGKENPLNKNR